MARNWKFLMCPIKTSKELCLLRSSLLILLLSATLPFSALAAHLDDENLGGESPLLQRTVIGGEIVDANSKPAKLTVQLKMSILSPKDGMLDGTCSGTLIAKDLVLTAAHCVKDTTEEGLKTLSVVAVINGVRAVPVTNWLVEPGYRRYQDGNIFVSTNRPINDLALLKLASPIGSEGLVAEIPRSEMPIGSSQELVLAGFGRTEAKDPYSVGTLYFAYSTGTMKNVDDLDHQISMDGVQPCLGDSGGPIYQADEKHFVLVGVTSHGATDCSQAGRGISVFFHLPWIKSAAKQLRSAISI
jgi:hypothetical protein